MTSGDFFPQNQWIVTEKNEEEQFIKMYVLGRYGTYFVHIKRNDEEVFEIKQAELAEEGFNQHHEKYIE